MICFFKSVTIHFFCREGKQTALIKVFRENIFASTYQLTILFSIRNLRAENAFEGPVSQLCEFHMWLFCNSQFCNFRMKPGSCAIHNSQFSQDTIGCTSAFKLKFSVSQFCNFHIWLLCNSQFAILQFSQDTWQLCNVHSNQNFSLCTLIGLSKKNSYKIIEKHSYRIENKLQKLEDALFNIC